MVWLVDGRVRAAGKPGVIRDAGFAGWRGEEAAVVVEAVVRSDASGDDDRHGLTLLEGPWGPIWTRLLAHSPGDVVRVQIRAADVSLGLDREDRGSILNQFRVQVPGLTPGNRVRRSSHARATRRVGHAAGANHRVLQRTACAGPRYRGLRAGQVRRGNRIVPGIEMKPL